MCLVLHIILLSLESAQVYLHTLVFMSWPFGRPRGTEGLVLDLDRGRSPRTCHDDQWPVRSSGGERGGKDLAAPEPQSRAVALASHPL